MHYKCCNEWLNLAFVSNSENLRNNGKYWIIWISSEILCTDSSGSVGWALSLSLSLRLQKSPRAEPGACGQH
jgi:hypothetical protein